MDSNFKNQALEYAKEAVHEDQAGNYQEALCSYKRAIYMFKVQLKFEQDLKVYEVIEEKVNKYTCRVAEIRAIIKAKPTKNVGIAVQSKLKTLSVIVLVIVFFVVAYYSLLSVILFILIGLNC